MKKTGKVKPCKCGGLRHRQSKSGLCRKCYFAKRRVDKWGELGLKRCAECNRIMFQNVSLGTRRQTPNEYKKKRFCNHSCANAFLTRQRWQSGWKAPMIKGLRKIRSKPPLEELNRAFSLLGTHKAMAAYYDVSEETIANWVGRVKYLKNPNLVLREG